MDQVYAWHEPHFAHHVCCCTHHNAAAVCYSSFVWKVIYNCNNYFVTCISAGDIASCVALLYFQLFAERSEMPAMRCLFGNIFHKQVHTFRGLCRSITTLAE